MWIDQICINQEDEAEKVQQVRLMSDIYHSAFSTIIWLGPGGQNTAEAMELIHEVNYRWQDLPENDHLAKTGLGGVNTAPWQGVHDLLARAWFTRLWTVQEAVLSAQPWIMCGEHILSFEAVGTFCSKLEGTSVATALENLYDTRPERRLNPLWWSPFMLQRMRHACPRPTLRSDAVERPWLVANSIEARHAMSSDPRDKIYGMMGMIETRLADKIKVSYAQDHTAATTFHDAAVAELAIHPGGIPFLLCGVDHEPHSKLPDLPSWVPDWSQPRLSKTLAASTITSHIYNASFARSGKPLQYSHMRKPKKRELSVYAWVFDTIESVSETSEAPFIDIDEPASKNGELAAWVAVASNPTTSEAYNGSVFEAFWRTLVADKSGEGLGIARAPESFAEIFSLVLDETTGTSPSLAGQTYSARQMMPVGRGRLELASLKKRKPAETFANIQATHKSAMRYRRLGRMTSGRIGLFPRYARPGDVLCVVHQMQVPCVIRRRDDGRHTFLGECYVHGVMQGQVVSSGAVEQDVIVFV